MNTNDIMFAIILGWICWFFFGGAWAVIRVTIGACGFKDGDNKWSGFVSLFWWAVINLVITLWFFFEYGNWSI